MDETVDQLRELVTLDDLSNRTGVSVRNVRFYTTKGLLPPPIRRGRSGYYTPSHVALLELISELQSHGFTLSAISSFLEQIPAGASPEEITLHGTTLAPWMASMPTAMPRKELEKRAGRALSEDDLETLTAMGIVQRSGRGWQVAISHLHVGITLIDLGFPAETARAAGEIYARHGQALAEELNELFETHLWPLYAADNDTPEKLQEVVERLKPLSIASMVKAYEAALRQDERDRALS